MRINTRLLQAELLTQGGIDFTREPYASQFQTALSTRRGQGYVEEDATVIAMMDVDSGRMPKVLDLNATAPRNSAPFLHLRDTEPGIYPIVDRNDQLAMLCKAGARVIQLRVKSDTLTPEIERQIRDAVRISQDFPAAQLFVNDHWSCAIEYGAFGVHLGQEDVLAANLQAIQQAGLRLGLSSHSHWEVARALTISPSYVACGPIYPTRAKAMPWIAQGIDNLRYWVQTIPHPVVGIGGIHSGNLDEVRATGCASAAIIQAIVTDPDPAGAFQKLAQQWGAGYASKQIAAAPLARPTL
jgi:hydroxymethylpyrimidine kinase/phosphomethylpyrimidine kinase/thiamine-phosphate diphosphorylase